MNAETSIVLKALVAFAHPLIMACTLMATVYALYLGVQTRRARNAEADIRKQMVKQKFGQRHFQWGAVLLSIWVIGGITGMTVTYTMYHRLFVSPHLIFGLSTLCFAALAVTLVPVMQQGKEWARITHIICASLVVFCFVTQTLTGFQIVQKLATELFV
jgi:hypothetical protein